MSYLRSSLTPGETVQHVARTHWVIFLVPTLKFSLGMAILVAVVWFEAPEWASWIGYVVLAWGSFYFLQALIYYLTTELAVTNRKVLGKWGILRRSTIEQRLEKIDAIEVHQTVMGRLMGFGTVIIRGSGVQTTPIARISNPLDFRHAVDVAAAALNPR